MIGVRYFFESFFIIFEFLDIVRSNFLGSFSSFSLKASFSTVGQSSFGYEGFGSREGHNESFLNSRVHEDA